MLDNPGVGFDYVPAYAVPGIPWLTSSYTSPGVMTEINFEYVTTFILLKNAGPSEMQVSFSPTGVANGKFITLSSTEALSAEFRVKRMYITAVSGSNFEVMAGLTLINSRMMPELSGAWGGVG